MDLNLNDELQLLNSEIKAILSDKKKAIESRVYIINKSHFLILQELKKCIDNSFSKGMLSGNFKFYYPVNAETLFILTNSELKEIEDKITSDLEIRINILKRDRYIFVTFDAKEYHEEDEDEDEVE